MNYHLIYQDSISTVLDKAREYRVLRELDSVISIYIDVFAVDSDN
ncbi:hypothetical protein [Candidatus Ruthturnera calyptogenae]|nr:hypothetical protein [Candidatus Ruthturnera calyptogenae]